MNEQNLTLSERALSTAVDLQAAFKNPYEHAYKKWLDAESRPKAKGFWRAVLNALEALGTGPDVKTL